MYSPKQNKLASKKMFLVTGYKSGLGRFLYERFGGFGLDRNTSDKQFQKIKRERVDTIIHCAGQGPKKINQDSLFSYVDDNVLLTKRVAEIPHRKFVFISTVDVYPKTKGAHNEEEEILVEDAEGFYALTKLMSESIIRELSPNYLILRCSALLGTYSRQNSLIRIAEEKDPKITLSSSSVMNYIRHDQVADFIEYAIKKNLKGIYNIVSSENIIIRDVAKLLSKKVSFGSYNYNVGNISNRKISKIISSFDKSSEEVIEEFLEEDLPKRKK